MNLKELRISFGITALIASSKINVPLRTYVRYENDNNYGNIIKRQYMIDELKKNYCFNETYGIYNLNQIKDGVKCIINNNYKDKVGFVYLFGSYAKGYAKENSDIDMIIDTDITGMDYYGLIEEIREYFNKKIDLIRLKDIHDNIDLLREVIKDGIKIYEQ